MNLVAWVLVVVLPFIGLYMGMLVMWQVVLTMCELEDERAWADDLRQLSVWWVTWHVVRRVWGQR